MNHNYLSPNSQKSLDYKQEDIINYSLHTSSQKPSANRNPKRLVIDKIILEDFKSYAGVKVIGPFDKRFSSVVGPNGSGKSNLIESLLFVFGKRANWMRLNKLSDLIHNSTESNVAKKASVEVDDPEDFDTIEGSHISIKRTVYSTSVTKYEMNGGDSTQGAVIDVLKSKGIDLNNNRFLILQGEVELISLMKPKTGKVDDPGLLEYLEDIIGSNQYISRLEEADKEIEIESINRKECHDLSKTSENELQKLEGSKEMALDFLNREKRVFQMKSISIQVSKCKLKVEEAKREEECHSLQLKYNEEHRKAQQKVAENEELLQAFEKSKRELGNVKEIKRALDDKFKAIEVEDVKINAAIKEQISIENKVTAELEKHQISYNAMVNEFSSLSKEIPTKTAEVEVLGREKEIEEEKLTSLMNNLKARTEDLRNEKSSIEDAISNQIQELKDLDRIIEKESRSVALLDSDENERRGQLEKLASGIARIEREIEDTSTKISEVEEAENNLIQIQKGVASQLTHIKGSDSQTKSELLSVNARIAETKSRQNEYSSTSQLIRELMNANANGTLSGICGRLGDLGTIDEKYDTAVTTAVPKLGWIVVEKLDQAIEAVNFLRENRIGKGNFIALDKIAGSCSEMNQPFNTPPHSSRLFDLITPKSEKFAVAFYFAMRNTLVTANLDKATELGYSQARHRVVTEEGYLIEPSGTLSGGGKPRKGGMSNRLINDNRESIDNLDNLRTELQSKLDEITREILRLTDQEKELGKDQATLTKERQKSQFSLEHLQKSLVNQKNSLALQSKPQEIDKKSAVERLVTIQEKRNKISNGIKKPRDRIMALEDKIARFGGPDLITQQESTSNAMTVFETADKELKKMKMRLETCESQIKNFNPESHKLKTKLSDTISTKEELKAALAALEEQATEILGRREAATDKIKSLENSLSQDSSEKAELERLIKEIKEGLDKVNADLVNAKNSLRRIRESHEKKRMELGSLRNQYISIKQNYDFLPFLSSLDTSFQTSMILPNNTLNLSILEEENEESGKKKRIDLDTHQLFTYEVEDDLPDEKLRSLFSFETPLSVKLQFEEEKLKALSPNLSVIMEYKDRMQEYRQRKKRLDDSESRLQLVRDNMMKLKKARLEDFLSGFTLINRKLKETYQILTNGGDAELEMIDRLDPFAEGIIFSVRPPKKSWKQMSKLSGGEKTLSSLSLIFALHYYKANPLYFMDEIDAALDYKNVAIVGEYIKQRTKNAQFIIISLRNYMFNLADMLIGIYKVKDKTRTIPFCPSKAVVDEDDKENVELND